MKSDETLSSLSDKKQEDRLSYGAIIRNAIHHYEALCPHHSPIAAIGLKTGIHTKKLERAVKDDAELTIVEFANIMQVCCYPEGFDKLRDFYFPHLRS